MLSAQPQRAYLTAFAIAIAAAVFFQLLPVLQDVRTFAAAPYQFDYEEGNILNALVRVASGQTPYPDPHALPNVINPYGPVAYYALALPVKIFGAAFHPARLLVVSCAAAVCLLLALLIWRQTRSLPLAFAFGGLYAALPVVSGWIWILRVDFLAIAFTGMGLVVFCNDKSGPQSRKSRIHHQRLLISAFFFSLALLTKYSLLAAPAACALQLTAGRRWRDLVRFLAAMAIFCGVVLAAFAIATRGAILTDLFRSHADPFIWNSYFLRMMRMVAVHWPLVALSVVSLTLAALRQLPGLPVLWLCLATAGAITAGKLGSGWNHFLEWPAALCLCAALGFHALSQLPTRIVSLVLTSAAGAWVLWFVLQPRPSIDAYYPVEGCSAAYAWVRNDAGPNLLSENVGALVLANKQVWVSNPFVLNMLILRAGWPDPGVSSMIAERRFDAILLSRDYPSNPVFLRSGTDRFSPAQLQAIASQYRIERRFRCDGINVVYTPNPLQSR